MKCVLFFNSMEDNAPVNGAYCHFLTSAHNAKLPFKNAVLNHLQHIRKQLFSAHPQIENNNCN